MSLLAHEERDIENMQADFDVLLAKEDWKGAQAIIDNLWDIRQDVLAEILRRAYLKAQYESVEDDVTFEPFTHEEAPLLEAHWFEGTPQEYADEFRTRIEEAESRYQSRKAQV